MAKSKISLKKISYWILALTLISRFILLFQKFRISGLPFAEYNWLNIGNIINIMLIVIFISAFFINLKYISRFEILLIAISIINILLNVLPVRLEIISEKLSSSYIFNSPAEKIFSAFLNLFVEFGFVYQIALISVARLVKSNFIYFKSALLSANYFILLVIFTYLFILKSPHSAEEDISEQNNLGVVLGAAVWSDNNPSPLFQSRIRKAFLMLRSNKISTILLTGGMAPGELSEAQSASELLKKLGVPENRMILEQKTSTTIEQIKFIASKYNLSSYDKIIIISDSFHLARVHEMCKFLNLDALQIPSGHELKWEKLLYYRLRETFALLLFWLSGI